MSNMLIEVVEDRVYPLPYGNLPECYKGISIPLDSVRKDGCTWRINGEKCKKKWINDYTYYCEEHKDISDMKRVIHEPLTTCTKRKSFIQYVNA